MSVDETFRSLRQADIAELRRWRLALQKRYEAGEMYDRLDDEQRFLFNRMAPEFIGTADELVLCVESILTSSRSAPPSTQG